MGALLDFFSLEHQAELICNAQLLDQYYENILIEYGKLLKLRTCFLPMHLENSIPGSYSVVKVPLLCCLKL